MSSKRNQTIAIARFLMYKYGLNQQLEGMTDEEYLAHPIGLNVGEYVADLMICTPLDTPFLNTFGTFIDRCEDQDFLQKHLLPVLIPMQMGETEPQAIKLTEDQDNEAFLDDFAVEDDMEL